ncbi:uncharacterized protein LACBIDRAFT_300213 [Laccaria bicolor S238N-H82]|uniref:Predicted protein n=1 Tax=Laccaria bicolor (strain S238N-H82 / ATCC MYA-4686) TaxID=486041 RepID=B0E3U3_LACBS|nr:uncharacterized protein LACBIDRAFT_300213 [Laccaria bicolor S238N-H82]EDQ98486.1 predicted protein [Laccaria bicolor S238N-H82]|eukprot:XP_001890859.1 predicted protein [Laccaria bicolor S238N-H82]
MLPTIFLSFYEYHNLSTGTKLPTKGKPTPKTKKTNPIEADDSDDSSISSLSDGSQGRLGKSDSDDEDDNDFDVAWMTDREFRQMFNRELPQAADAASLFDNDDDIEIATSRRGSSSEASRPPTSDSKGLFDDPNDSGEEEVDEDDTSPVVATLMYQLP